MKKMILLVWVLSLVSIAKAQSDFTFGPKFGLNLSNVSNSDGNVKASIHLGAFATAKITDFVGLQAELLYSRQGWSDSYDVPGLAKDVKVKCRVNYLNIPVLARLYVWDHLSVDLGPQLGFALNAKAREKYSGKTVKSKISHLNTIDVSFAVGASYELNWGILVSARYNIGLTNVFDKDHFRDGVTNKNGVFQLSVGYKLDF